MLRLRIHALQREKEEIRPMKQLQQEAMDMTMGVPHTAGTAARIYRLQNDIAAINTGREALDRVRESCFFMLFIVCFCFCFCVFVLCLFLWMMMVIEERALDSVCAIHDLNL